MLGPVYLMGVQPSAICRVCDAEDFGVSDVASVAGPGTYGRHFFRPENGWKGRPPRRARHGDLDGRRSGQIERCSSFAGEAAKCGPRFKRSHAR
jgi:hypothetical protein